jgi:hypothetical protein
LGGELLFGEQPLGFERAQALKLRDHIITRGRWCNLLLNILLFRRPRRLCVSGLLGLCVRLGIFVRLAAVYSTACVCLSSFSIPG